MRVVAAYLRSGLRIPPPPEEWDALLDNPLPTIVAGDLNANHPSWKSRVANAYGKSLYRFVSDPVLQVIGPEAVSYTHLDVYKRQVLYTARIKIGCMNCRGRKKMKVRRCFMYLNFGLFEEICKGKDGIGAYFKQAQNKSIP